MEALKSITFAVLAAVTYGILHDHVTAHLCVEYFSGARSDVELVERTLLYVAATRAKQEVWVTGYGERSEFVPPSDASA